MVSLLKLVYSFLCSKGVCKVAGGSHCSLSLPVCLPQEVELQLHSEVYLKVLLILGKYHLVWVLFLWLKVQLHDIKGHLTDQILGCMLIQS